MQVTNIRSIAFAILVSLTVGCNRAKKDDAIPIAQEPTGRLGAAYVEKETKLLERFGIANDAKIILTKNRSMADLGRDNEHLEQTRLAIVGEKISVNLRRLALKLGAINDGVAFLVLVSQPQEFAFVQQQLGSADGPPRTEEGPHIWHDYGWLSFGVRDGKVVALEAVADARARQETRKRGEEMRKLHEAEKQKQRDAERAAIEAREWLEREKRRKADSETK